MKTILSITLLCCAISTIKACKCGVCYYDLVTFTNECCKDVCLNRDREYCNKHGCQKVHGGWSEWTPWGQCNATCDFNNPHKDLTEIWKSLSGHQLRSRQCNSPSPRKDLGGRLCQDANGNEKNFEEQTRNCSMVQNQQCLGKFLKFADQHKTIKSVKDNLQSEHDNLKSANDNLKSANNNLKSENANLAISRTSFLVLFVMAFVILVLWVAYAIKREGSANKKADDDDGGKRVKFSNGEEALAQILGERNLLLATIEANSKGPTGRPTTISIDEDEDDSSLVHLGLTRVESGIESALPSGASIEDPPSTELRVVREKKQDSQELVINLEKMPTSSTRQADGELALCLDKSHAGTRRCFLSPISIVSQEKARSGGELVVVRSHQKALDQIDEDHRESSRIIENLHLPSIGVDIQQMTVVGDNGRPTSVVVGDGLPTSVVGDDGSLSSQDVMTPAQGFSSTIASQERSASF